MRFGDFRIKKCPFCKADIEDSARFCLYCMKPLDEKEVILPPRKKTPWWPLAVVVVLLAALTALMLSLPRGRNALPDQSTGGETALSTQTAETTVETTGETTQDTQGEDAALPEDTDTKDMQQSSGTTKADDPPAPKPDNITPPASTNIPPTQPEPPTQNTTPTT